MLVDLRLGYSMSHTISMVTEDKITLRKFTLRHPRWRHLGQIISQS